MSSRVDQEVALLSRHWPDLAYLPEDHWVGLASHPVPSGWTSGEVEVCFRVPADAATAPYGFYVRPALLLTGDSDPRMPSHCTNPAETPFGGGWAMFSWSPLAAWRPQDEIERGDNMLHFVKSFSDRLGQRE